MKTTTNQIDLVVVLAAGFGSRLHSEGDLPKPLRSIGGRALILRVLDTFARQGVTEAAVVLGHRAGEVQEAIEQCDLPLKTAFIENPRYQMSNGLSVLAAKPVIGHRNFFLSMSDHIFEPSLVEGLGSAQLPPGGLVLATDSKLDQIFDMDDATKVETRDQRIINIGKDLVRYDSVDTGLFACTPALLDAIEAKSLATPDGDCSLSDGVNALTAKGLARVHDIGDGLWQDVDTPGSMVHAETLFR